MDILALLFPQEKKFYKMIEEQVTLVGLAVSDFQKLISQYSKLSVLKRKKLIKDISEKEKRDDILYTRMVRELKSTFITPMDREDIHQLVVTFDNIIDTLELLTAKLSVYNIKKIDKYLILQTGIFHKSYLLLEKIILSIRSESEVEKYCLEVRRKENEGDDIYLLALGNLYKNKADAVNIYKLQDLYNTLEKMIDSLSETALIIENIAIKYS